jgi:hypothetical protein
MILTASMASVAACSYDCPFIWQFMADISYRLFGQQEGMANIFEFWKHQLDD